MKTSDQKTFNPIRKYPLLVLSIAFGLLFCYFLVVKAFPNLIAFAKESYGIDYWRRLLWIVPHTFLGVLALIIGPVQFIPQIRKTYVKTSISLGRLYILATVIGGIGGMLLATISDFQFPYAYSVGLFMLCFTWTASSIMAYLSSKNNNEEAYKEWMIRSYIITLAFVSFRFVLDILLSLNIGGNGDSYALFSCLVPLLLAEIIIQWNKNTPG